MNLNLLAANIKPLDLGAKPATSEAERDYFRHYKINFEESMEGVNHYFGHFHSGRFNIVTHYFENKTALETCFIVHGYYDHAGLYRHLIEYCLKRNFSVVIYDLPGHGLSTGEPASIASFSEYQSVLSDLLALFSAVAPAPWHTIGQSTGAAIVMDFLLSGNCLKNNTAVFDKTVLLAPLVRPVAWQQAKWKHVIASLFVKSIKRKFIVNSHDPIFLDFLKNRDPLQTRVLPMQWVSALKKWQRYFLSLPASNFFPLVVQGKEDTTVDWPYNLSVVKTKFPHAKVFYMNEARHQLVNESEAFRTTMFAAIDLYFDVYETED